MLLTAHATDPACDPHVDVAYDNVLLPVDGPEGAAWVLATGRAIADELGAQLRLAAIATHPDEVDGLRADLAASAGFAVDDPRLHVVVSDTPAEAVAELASSLDPCLLCMPTSARDRIGGAIAGSVTRDLLAESGRPILAVGPRAELATGMRSPWARPLSTRRLVACVDGSRDSERVLPVAAAWAGALDMPMTILTVAEPVPRPHRAAARDAATEYVEHLAAEWRGRCPDVSARVAYDPVSMADGVTSELDRHPAGLVAVATSLRRGWRRVPHEDAGMHVVRVSPVPVLLVPLPARPHTP